MSWLTDIAGKAENLLNKIDQNAATVIKELDSNNKTNGVQEVTPEEVKDTHKLVAILCTTYSSKHACSFVGKTTVTIDL